MRERKLTYFYVTIYMAWILKELVFSDFPNATLALIAVKLIVWVIPVYYYLKYIDQVQNPFTYLKLNHSISKGITWGLAVSLILIFLEAGLSLVFHSKINVDLGISWITTLIFAFPEEVLFRGFILQKLSRFFKFIKANVFSALLFVSIHFPVWFIQGMTVPKFIFNVIMVFLVGFGLGYLFKKSNSLWSAIIVHTVYNLLIYAR
jgi:uncharacterized protein